MGQAKRQEGSDENAARSGQASSCGGGAIPFVTFLLGNWKLIGIGLLVAAIGVQTFRLDLCQSGREEDRVSAEAERIRLSGLLKAQSDAVERLGKESAERKAKAEKGLKEASRNAQAARSEVERLRALASRKDAPATSCPAGEAVKAIREGLRK